MDNHSGCLAAGFPNEIYLYIISYIEARDETRFTFRKNLFTGQPTNIGNEMISRLIFLMRNTKRWPNADQPEKKCLSVLPDIPVVDAGINVDGNRRRGNVRGNSGQLDSALEARHRT